MKIISLKAENFKRIQAVELHPNGEAVVIQGANAQGKTSILDAIEVALKSIAIKKPIREGQDKAKIELDLGEYLVKKTITEKGAYLKVETKEGAELKSPQRIMDKIVGQISFDPLEFSRMKPADQRIALVKMVPALDFSKLDEERANIFHARTLTNRSLKTAEIARDEIKVPLNTPEVMVNVKEKLAQVNRLNSQISDEEKRVSGEMAAGEMLLAQVDRISGEINDLENALISKKARWDETKKELEDIGTPALLEQVKLWRIERDQEQSEIEQSEVTNSNVAKRISFNDYDSLVRSTREESDKQTKKIEKIDREKKAALEIIPLPIPGLGIGEKEITFNGIPFEDLALSEKLKVSFSMAMAQNPELKVVFIRDGSLLDAASRKYVMEVAAAKDYQIWMEVVDDNAKSGIIIEDGMLVPSALVEVPMTAAQVDAGVAPGA